LIVLVSFLASLQYYSSQLFLVIKVMLVVQVSVTGTFLVNKEHVEKCKWSCMFGDIEVPAEVLTDGTLRCYAPTHQSGRVPFYVTC
jgi:hypothetical protein